MWPRALKFKGKSRRDAQPERPARRRSARCGSIHHAHRVAARFLIRPQCEQPTFLAVGQQVIEGPEPVGALVEARVTALDGLFDHRAPDGFTPAALLGQ